MPERLLHHHAGRVGQARPRDTLDHHPEQRPADLEIEDRAARVADLATDALIGLVVAEVAGDVGEPSCQPAVRLLVDRLPAIDDALAGVHAQLVDVPVVTGNTHDRAVEQPAALESVERVKGHHLGEVAGDPEDDEHVGRCSVSVQPVGSPGSSAVLMGGPIGRELAHSPTPRGSCHHPLRMIRVGLEPVLLSHRWLRARLGGARLLRSGAREVRRDARNR